MEANEDNPIDVSTPYTAIDIAHAFLMRAQNDPDKVDDISNMKLNKLVYFAQVVGVCAKNKAVHCNHTHAWDYGPVVPKLYRVLKPFGAKCFSLNDEAVRLAFDKAGAKPITDKQTNDIIDMVWGTLKQYSAGGLMRMTHRAGTPWSEIYAKEKYGVIPLELMREKEFGHP